MDAELLMREWTPDSQGPRELLERDRERVRHIEAGVYICLLVMSGTILLALLVYILLTRLFVGN